MATVLELDRPSTAYKIDKDIPVPGTGKRGGGKYPFSQMEVGDSVFIPGVTVTKIANALSHHKRDGRNFTSRTVDGGVRTWRIA